MLGKVSKTKIDLIVFGSLVRTHLETKRVSTLLEQCALYELVKDINNTIILNNISHLVYEVKQSPKQIEEGKISPIGPH